MVKSHSDVFNLRKSAIGRKSKGLYQYLLDEAFYLHVNTVNCKGHLNVKKETRQQISGLIESLVTGTYKPNMIRLVGIKNNHGKSRTIGIVSERDKLLQRAILHLLGVVFDHHFSDSSHAYRKGKGPLTAIKEAKEQVSQSNWLVHGDIDGFFDNVSHAKLLSLLERKITDSKFIDLISQILKTDCQVAKGTVLVPTKGLVQGTVIGPILSNIYLNEFDKWLIKYRQTKKGFARRGKLCHIRYSDDFLIGISGKKADVQQVLADCCMFLEKELDIKLNLTKTELASFNQAITFLGYTLKLRKSHHSSYCECRFSMKKCQETLARQGILAINNEGKWKITAVEKIIAESDESIVTYFQTRFDGLRHYYSYADSYRTIDYYLKMARKSLLRTLAMKHDISVKRINRYYSQTLIGNGYEV